MSLAEKLQEIREIAKQRIPEETRARMQQATVELRNSGHPEHCSPGRRADATVCIAQLEWHVDLIP